MSAINIGLGVLTPNISEKHLHDFNITTEDAFYTGVESNFFTYHMPDKIILICFYVPVFFVALVGNILVLLMVYLQRAMKRNTTNYFLVNLAVADLLVTIFCIPLTIAENIYTLWMYGDFMCRITGFLQGIYVEASVLTIVCMSIDRYLAIRHPMKSRAMCNHTRVKQLILLTWILAAVIMAPLLIVKKLEVYKIDEYVTLYFCKEDWPSFTDRQIYDVFLLFCAYIVPGTIVVVLYTRIGCSLWKPDHALQRENSVVSNELRMLTCRRKLARMMIAISVLFAVSWMPYFIVNLGMDFLPHDKDHNNRSNLLAVYPFALLLGHSNSAQNPLLYCFMHKGFNNFLHKLFRCRYNELRLPRQGSTGQSIDKSKPVTFLGSKIFRHKKQLVIKANNVGTPI